jgi:hypothetical protein
MGKSQHRLQIAAQRDRGMARPKQRALGMEGIRIEFAALDPRET